MEGNSGKVVNFTMYFMQCDWNDALASFDKKETVWLSSKGLTDNKEKVYNLKVVNDKSMILEAPTDDLDIISCSHRCFIIEEKTSKVQHRFLPPLKCYTSIHKKSIISLDVALNGIAISSSNDGSLKVWDTVNGEIKHNLEGHFLDVNKCRLFPSNQVVLSAGADMQMKIWSAIDGKCPVTLLGHKGAVMDLAIVDKGRNVISVGRDGLVKLWSCAKGKCIEDIFDISKDTQDDHGRSQSINVCKIRSISSEFNLGLRQEPPCEDAVGTEDKLLLIGTESGFVYGLGVHSKQMVLKVKSQSAVNAITFCKEYNFAYGTQSGLFYECDLRKPDQVLTCWNFHSSPILSMLFVRRPFDGLVVGRQDGSVTFVYDNHLQVVHLTGSDCDPVYELAYDQKFIYAASRDGKVRKYLLNYAFELA